jgi:phage terminase small subunit
MAARGFATRKPIAEMIRTGTARADRHAHRTNPTAPAGHPIPPPDLGPLARRAWEEVITACDTLRITSAVDSACLYQYAQLWAETEETALARTDLLRSIATLETSVMKLTGSKRLAAITLLVQFRKLERKCIDQLRQGRTCLKQFLLEFGLTPAARNRIHVPTTEEPEDAFAAFQSKRPT